MRTIIIATLSALLGVPAAYGQQNPTAAEQPKADSQVEPPQAQVQIESLRNRLQTTMNQIDIETISKGIKELKEKREQLLLDEAGASGRRQGLEEAVKRFTEMAKSRGDSDPVVAELEKVVALRQQELDRMKQLYKTGTVSAGDASNVELVLAQARAELAAAKQKVAGGAGLGEALDTWNRESINLSIEAEERRARLDYIAGRLKMLGRLISDYAALANEFDSLNPHWAGFGRHSPKQKEIEELIERSVADYAALASLPSTSPETQPTRANGSPAD